MPASSAAPVTPATIAKDGVLEDGLYAGARATLAQRNEKAAQTLESSKLVMILSLVVGVLLGLGGLLWVRRRITHPVRRLMSQIRRQGEG